jgi:hypothetical protein
MAGRELFVWYRVRPDKADKARAEVVAMQRSLMAEFPALKARLLQRGDASTWMETYASTDPGGVDALIEGAIAQAALDLADMLDGDRHVEAFSEAT